MNAKSEKSEAKLKEEIKELKEQIKEQARELNQCKARPPPAPKASCELQNRVHNVEEQLKRTQRTAQVQETAQVQDQSKALLETQGNMFLKLITTFASASATITASYQTPK